VFIKTSRYRQTLFAAVTQLDEGLSIEILLTLEVAKPLVRLVGTWTPTISITEQRLILSLKT
jgi:hypothetical protein